MAMRLKPGGPIDYFHIITRIAQQCWWLEEAEVKDIFMDLLDFYSEVYYVKPLAHAIMSSHVHMCLEVSHPEFDPDDIRRRHALAQSRLTNPRELKESQLEHFYNRYTDLSWFMWEINRRMSLAYNKIMGTKGHLWSGRFKSIVVEPGENLLRVIAYIDGNAERAKIVKDPSDFEYCSVGRARKQLEKGAEAKAPDIPVFNRLPKEIRAKTYIDLIRYVAQERHRTGNHKTVVPIQFTRLGMEIDFGALNKALKNREPSNWSSPTYGSAEFTRKTYEQAGWLPLQPIRAKPKPKAA